MNKPGRSARPLAALLGPCLVAAFKRHGFASTEIVTHWADIVGAEIAAHAEPIKITWPRQGDVEEPEPATLVLRCEGPAVLEIQHLTDVIIERINRFLGWRAIGHIALRQAPLTRRDRPKPSGAPDPKAVAEVAKTLTSVEDEELRAALARLGASIKRN